MVGTTGSPSDFTDVMPLGLHSIEIPFFGLILNGAVSTPYLDNVAQSTGTNALTTAMIIGGRTLSEIDSTLNQWEGPISDIVITNSALRSTDRNNLDTYFTCQWGT